MRKWSGVPSGELSDTRRLGSADARWYASQGKKAVFRRRSIAARNAVKTPGETARGAGYHPRPKAEPPKAVARGVRGRGATLRDELDQRCQARSRSGPQPSGPKQGEASCAGLRPEDIYVYGERSQGRANRPPCTGSTVAPTVTAHWKANQRTASS